MSATRKNTIALAPTVAHGSLERSNECEFHTPYTNDVTSTRFRGADIPPGGYSPSAHGSSKFRANGPNKSLASIEYCGFDGDAER